MSRQRADVRLKWGHRVYDLEGNEIRVPASLLVLMRRLNVLAYNVALHGHQLTLTVHEFMKPEYDAIAGELRRVLGSDLSGPATVKCGCRKCNDDAALLLHEIEQLNLFRLDMAVQQSAR